MSQTSYSRVYVNAFAGMLGDSGFKYVQTRVNGNAGQLPAGIAVKDTSTDGNADVLSAAGDKVSGIIVNSFARDPGSAGTSLTGTNAVLPKHEMNILSEGTIFVKPEQTCTLADPVYVRFATGSGTVIGAFRKDADGVAQVTTGTPTASQNATIFVLRVAFGAAAAGGAANGVWEFEYVSDGSMTATEVVTGFKTLMAADAAFSALVTASGTSTLILTGANAGQAFTVTSEGDGAWSSITTGTPPAPTARPLKAARYLHNQGTSGVQMLYFSAALDAALT